MDALLFVAAAACWAAAIAAGLLAILTVDARECFIGTLLARAVAIIVTVMALAMVRVVAFFRRRWPC